MARFWRGKIEILLVSPSNAQIHIYFSFFPLIVLKLWKKKKLKKQISPAIEYIWAHSTWNANQQVFHLKFNRQRRFHFIPKFETQVFFFFSLNVNSHLSFTEQIISMSIGRMIIIWLNQVHWSPVAGRRCELFQENWRKIMFN